MNLPVNGYSGKFMLTSSQFTQIINTFFLTFFFDRWSSYLQLQLILLTNIFFISDSNVILLKTKRTFMIPCIIKKPLSLYQINFKINIPGFV